MSSYNEISLVPPTTYTTFYIGALANAKQIDEDVRSFKPDQ